MKTSIIIPIYNEVLLLPTVLRRVRALDFDKELILVDDFSRDGTRELLRSEEGKPGTVVLYHDRNRGKGRAIRTGLERATGDAVIIQDADMEYVPEEIPAVLGPIWRGEAAVCYGSRFLGHVENMMLPNYCGNMILAWLVRVLFFVRLSDEATAYKAFRRDVIAGIPLTCERFEFCPEVTARTIRRGHRIVEVPVSFFARTVEEGKKIGWRDFITATKTLLRFRFVR